MSYILFEHFLSYQNGRIKEILKNLKYVQKLKQQEADHKINLSNPKTTQAANNSDKDIERTFEELHSSSEQ